MSDRLTRFLVRAASNRDTRGVTPVRAPAPTLSAEGRLGCTFIAGDRVFDRVTGEEGTVVAATRDHIVGVAA